MLKRKWCDECRGEEDGDKLLVCASCPRRFHNECVGLREKGQVKGWTCPHCDNESDGNESDDGDSKATKATRKAAKAKRIAAVHKAHNRLRASAKRFVQRHEDKFAPFLSDEQKQKKKAVGAGAGAKNPAVAHIGPHEPFVKAQLRDYQVAGVNWIIDQYNAGVGGILGDEMGLGKTIQTLTFLSALKAAGLPGPHLVVTPLAVLLNWTIELQKFTPGLSVCRIQGSLTERDRVLAMPKVLAGEFDVYLTTYEVVQSEEAFFTESFLWHTITIDEGHRLKNEGSSLCAALSRVRVPFRLLLTGTPLQNNLHELWALLHYVLPGVLASDAFDNACDIQEAKVCWRSLAHYTHSRTTRTRALHALTHSRTHALARWRTRNTRALAHLAEDCSD
jgi:SNF2 family DNA or RNA helicase